MTFSLRERRMGRRQFLVASAAGVLVGGAVFKVSRMSRPGQAAAAVIQPIADAPLAFLSDESVPQGSAFSIHVSTFDAGSATATFNGQQVALLQDAEGSYLIGLFGAGQSAGDEQEIEPGDYMVEVDAAAASGRPFTVSLPIAVSTTDFPVDRVDLPPSTSALLAPDLFAAEVATLQQLYAPTTAKMLWQGLFQRPVAGPLTTSFGQSRSYNGGPVSGHHSGVDIGADLGTPVTAAAAGVVVYTGALSERGNFIAIDHGLGVYTGYAHLSRILAAVGAAVKPGDVIGLVGTTGLSTGPHLHWEVAVHGINVDALRWTWNLMP